MNRRNFKVRIKNLNVKEPFALIHSPSYQSIYKQYDDMMIRLGYTLVEHTVDKTTTAYVYYPLKMELAYRKERHKLNRKKNGKPIGRRPRPVTKSLFPGAPRARPRRLVKLKAVKWRLPEHEVLVEITMLFPTQKYK